MRRRSLWCLAAAVALPLTIDAGPNPTHPGFPGVFNEDFDAVVAPDFPIGWQRTLVIGQVGDAIWETSTTSPFSPTNDAFAPAPAHLNDNRMDTPLISIPVAGGQLRTALVFWHSYAFETGFDGGVVEIKIGAGAFTDIIAAGAVALNSGYNGTISMNFQNPLAGRQAFTGNPGGYVRSMFRLPAATYGQDVKFRFRVGTDVSNGTSGWRVDDVQVTNWGYGDYDFNGDFKTDRTIFRPSNNVWYTALNGGGSTVVGWGAAGDIDVSADYDGDGKNDVAVWRPSSGTWFIIKSSNGTVQVAQWGQSGDIPMAGLAEFPAFDASSDFVIWRPSTGVWFVKRSTGQPDSIFAWGTNGDQPLLGDYTGFRWIEDAVIYRPTTGVWYIAADGGQGSTLIVPWGTPGDIPVAGDWDGDSRNDVAVFRPSTGQWWIRNSHDLTTTTVSWGMNGDIPVSGDFNGDGRSDFTVWRPSNGVWFTQYSNTGGTATVGWGVPGDLPVGRRPGT